MEVHERPALAARMSVDTSIPFSPRAVPILDLVFTAREGTNAATVLFDEAISTIYSRTCQFDSDQTKKRQVVSRRIRSVEVSNLIEGHETFERLDHLNSPAG